MKARDQNCSQEAAALLRDISMYRALTEAQILGLYPGKEGVVRRLLSHLAAQARVFYKDGLYFAGQDRPDSIDWGLLDAVWVLLDFIDRVDYHSAGELPVKVIFIADGEVYEIVHAEQGREHILAHLLRAKGDETSRYLVLVDDPAQIAELELPHVCGYCTVAPNGEVQYYQKE